MVSFRQFAKEIQHYLYKFDIFGSPLNLQIKRDQEYHTVFGLIMSCGILIFILFSGISLIIDLLEQQSPNVIQNTQYQQNPQEYTLNSSSFMFAIALTDVKGVPYTITPGKYIYTLELQSCTRQSDSSSKVKSLCKSFILRPCLSLNISSQIATDMNLSKATLAASVCLDPEEWNNNIISLQGTPQSTVFKSLFFTLSQCSNDTMNNECASQEEIDIKLSSAYIAFILADKLLNQKQRGYPYQTVAKLTSTTIAASQYKSLTIYMRKSMVINQENFYYYFGQKTTSYQALQVDHSQEYVDYVKRNAIIQVAVYLDDRENIHYRTYDNILNIFGQVGGLLEFLTLLGGLFIKPINKLSEQLFLACEIYSFDQQEYGKAVIHPDLSFTESENDQLRLSKLKKYFKLKYSQLKINVLSYFTYPTHSRKSINYSVNQIYRKIDVIYFLNKMIEIDKLKKLILSEDQQSLFNYIHKPRVALSRLNRSRVNSFYENGDETYEQKMNTAFESYKRIKKNHHQIDKNLLSLMDNDIKLLFEGQLQVGQNTSIQQLRQETDQNEFLQAQKQDTMILETINPD